MLLKMGWKCIDVKNCSVGPFILVCVFWKIWDEVWKIIPYNEGGRKIDFFSFIFMIIYCSKKCLSSWRVDIAEARVYWKTKISILSEKSFEIRYWRFEFYDYSEKVRFRSESKLLANWNLVTYPDQRGLYLFKVKRMLPVKTKQLITSMFTHMDGKNPNPYFELIFRKKILLKFWTNGQLHPFPLL